MSCPGKAFFFGEYAALVGAPSLVVALEPRFTLGHGRPLGHHGPIGKLRAVLGDPPWLHDCLFFDPYQGAGGFGASGAEALLVARQAGIQNWPALIEAIKDGSGADMYAQLHGGAWHNGQQQWERFASYKLRLYGVSHLGRKVKTHEHLSQFDRSLLGPIKKVMQSMEEAFFSGSRAQLGSTMMHAGDTLMELGLECEQMHADRLFFQSLPGVLGTKGAGAMQSDALWVLSDTSVDEEARQRGFRLFDLSYQKGIL